MGFKQPPGNKQVFLIAKNSQLPLGVRHPAGSPGSYIEQQAARPTGNQQHFLIHGAGHRDVYLKPGHNDVYMSVENPGSPASGRESALFVQGGWHPMAGHLRYQFISAGNGYYHVRSAHSGLLLDVRGNTKDAGANLMQMRYNGGDNQLFKVLLVPNQELAKDMRSFQQANEDVRNLCMMAAGGVPEVGTVLKGILGVLWKANDKDQDFWNQMKEYVDERIKAFILEERLDRLAELLRAILDNINELSVHPTGAELQANIVSLRFAEVEFLVGAKRNPLEVLPYLVAMGSLKLALLRQRVVNYDQLYPDADAQTDKAKRVAFYTKQLRANIGRYTQLVLTCRARALAWRMDKFSPIDTGQDFSPQARRIGYWSKANDQYDGWHVDRRYSTYTDSSRTDGDPGYRDFTNYAYTQRRQQAEIQFGAELDEYLHPARLWKHLLPGNPKPAGRRTLTQLVAGFGGRGGQRSFGVPPMVEVDPAQRKGRITEINVHTGHHGLVSGLELRYGNRSTGLIGATGTRHDLIWLDDDEFVTGVYGTYLGLLDSICFVTNKGKQVSGGNVHATGDPQRWTADLPDSFGARLVRVLGRYNIDTIEGLDFEWAYELEGTDLPRPEDIPDDDADDEKELKEPMQLPRNAVPAGEAG